MGAPVTEPVANIMFRMPCQVPRERRGTTSDRMMLTTLKRTSQSLENNEGLTVRT